MCRVELGIFRYPRLCSNGRDKWTEVDRFFLHAFTLFYKVTACGNRKHFFQASAQQLEMRHLFSTRFSLLFRSPFHSFWHCSDVVASSLTTFLCPGLNCDYGDSNPIVFWCLDTLTGELEGVRRRRRSFSSQHFREPAIPIVTCVVHSQSESLDCTTRRWGLDRILFNTHWAISR